MQLCSCIISTNYCTLVCQCAWNNLVLKCPALLCFYKILISVKQVCFVSGDTIFGINLNQFLFGGAGMSKGFEWWNR